LLEAAGTACLWATALLAAAAAVSPRARPRLALALVACAGVAAAVAAVEGGTSRTLAVTATFPAYEGNVIAAHAFPIETTAAPGFAWAALAALAALAAAAGARLAPRPGRRSLAAPAALAVVGAALTLALEKLAAPGAAVAFGFERATLPAAFAAAWLLARERRRVLHMLALLALFVTAVRLPLALFGTLATRFHLGTRLDVHAIDTIAHPVAQVPLELGPAEQLWYLIWWPQAVVLPALHLLAAGGVGFFSLMVERQREHDRRQTAPAPSRGHADAEL
jgi:hypothetical protein